MKRLLILLLFLLSINNITGHPFMHKHKEYIYCDYCHDYHKYEDLQKLWDSIYFEHVHYDNADITNEKNTNPYMKIIGGIALWILCTTVTSKIAFKIIDKHI